MAKSVKRELKEIDSSVKRLEEIDKSIRERHSEIKDPVGGLLDYYAQKRADVVNKIGRKKK